MSRTYINPKTKKFLNGMPDTVAATQILSITTAKLTKLAKFYPGVLKEEFGPMFPYQMDRAECLILSNSILNAKKEQIQEIYSEISYLFQGNINDFQDYLNSFAKYLRRLKYGFDTLAWLWFDLRLG